MSDDGKEKRLQALTALSQIHCSIRANLQLEEISQMLLDALVDVVGCAGCAMLLIGRHEMKILAEHGFQKIPEEEMISALAPAIKRVIDTKKSIHADDIAHHPAVRGIHLGCAVKSMICTPVVINDQVAGMIHLVSPDANAFDTEALSFVELMGDEMSIAMERSFLQSQVQELTTTDSLTGCFNRKKLHDDLEIEIDRARRYHRPLTLFLVVVDWFKKYHDYHGCEMSDALLRDIASVFRRNLRRVDRVYRYGGEDFVILLPETKHQNAELVAKRTKMTIERQKFEGAAESQPNKRITVSIGVASFPWDGESQDELLRSAAFALYRAKHFRIDKRGVIRRVKIVKKAIRHLL